jgi:hypothetical protein
MAAEQDGANLGLEHLLSHIRDNPRRFCLLPADLVLPDDPDLRSVPVANPTPLYAWSLIWHGQHEPRSLAALLATAAQTGGRRRWLDFDPDLDWLPAGDRAQLRRQSAGRRTSGGGTVH